MIKKCFSKKKIDIPPPPNFFTPNFFFEMLEIA